MGFKEKLNQIFYALSTEDRYADYDSHNHHARTVGAGADGDSNTFQLNDANGFQEEGDDSGIYHSTEGVSETILAWRHIETWTSENHSDLNASLADPCTRTDISRAEKDLGIVFPPPVRASLRIHDGQEDMESLTGIGGLFFGLQLMNLDEIVHMTKTWRLVADRINLDSQVKTNLAATQALLSPAGSSTEVDKTKSTTSLNETHKGFKPVDGADYKNLDPDLEKRISSNNSKKFKSHIPKQFSCPAGAIHPVYSHQGWVPLVTDNSGNHIGVDLSPAKKGTWGQVILFGRDFDTKFVLAPTWGDFLLLFVKDLENGNYIIREEEDMFAGEGEVGFFDKKINREIPYLQVLAQRMINQYRTQSKELPTAPNSETKIQSKKDTPVSHILPKAGNSSSADRIVSTDIANESKSKKESEGKKTENKIETKETNEDDLLNEDDEDTKKDDTADQSEQDIGKETLVSEFESVKI
ncbi:Cell wall assembly regulator [Wickerhamomyces ciferrii]|uniref:Cell wall assembly regulator n=1 Tax=Wickerhamomyces ciferrii (strain ATCC 14091 / BCRC 22168 / CBS 111 / JCM 3599 / NBRC 0793 / NRRL Y-1031 F-60-10) TaxID=1206466 RepID=K0KET1_WICCF|nr:Cell wall assembly regulator [Wickerhamomyces ciferrii]CCH41446.1 Cell wall assembly regulator [Wickerhamomyces ciferrii]